MILETEENIIIADNIIIGIYNGILSRTGKYSGLVGLELLEVTGNGEERIDRSIVTNW